MAATGCAVRPVEERDLDALAAFEVRIARISFPDDPIVDLAAHRARLRRAMLRDGAGMLVAEDEPGGRVTGWLWVSLNRNFTTGRPYAQFRSLAVEPGFEGRGVAEHLCLRGLDYARAHGVEEVIGRVHVSNVPMRLVYRPARVHPPAPDDAAEAGVKRQGEPGFPFRSPPSAQRVGRPGGNSYGPAKPGLRAAPGSFHPFVVPAGMDD